MAALTVPDKLLIAAQKLNESGKARFTAEDLVVCAWECFPETFGLSGYKDQAGSLKYPDSNRVFAEIMGSKPIRKKGHLTKVGKKLYKLTPSGLEAANRLIVLQSVSTEEAVKQSGLSRDLRDELSQLLRSRAVDKYENEQYDTISFQDACMFWGINPRSKAIDLDMRFAHLKWLIKLAVEEAEHGEVEFSHGGKRFSGESLRVLRETNEFLEERFGSDLEVIRERTDQRKR